MGGSFSIPNPIDQILKPIQQIGDTANKSIQDVKDPNYLKKVLGLNAAADAEKKRKEQEALLAKKIARDQQAYENLRQKKLLSQRSLIQSSPYGLSSFSESPNFWQMPSYSKLGE